MHCKDFPTSKTN